MLATTSVGLNPEHNQSQALDNKLEVKPQLESCDSYKCLNKRCLKSKQKQIWQKIFVSQLHCLEKGLQLETKQCNEF